MRPSIRIACAAACSLGVAALADEARPMERIVVIAATPLPGTDLDIDRIAAPVQAATGARIEASNALDVSGFLRRFFGSVHVNDIQGNPFQPDINYRGFTASPLLGTPQGLSVYMDGVRLNQPFGDVVSWDLIPRAAISSIALMPGSNPLFGLNTLGGALVIQTKDGVSHPGTSVAGYYGSNARWATELEHGGSNANGLDWYVTGNLFREHGWRDDSPSRVGQLFAKAGWRGSRTRVSATAAYANTDLTGNGLQEERLLEQRYSSVYTKPDTTANKSLLLNLLAAHDLDATRSLSGNAYYRHINTGTLNGDLNDDSLGERIAEPATTCLAAVATDDEPNEKCNGLLNRTHTSQDNYGATGQLSWTAELAGRPNQLTVGAAYDASKVRFNQSAQYGYLNPDRSVTPVDDFADDARVDLQGRSDTWSVFATDTLRLGAWSVTGSGRYNRTVVHNRDQLAPGGGPGSLDGDTSFSRFNPALGVTFAPTPALTTYLGYSQGSRAPSAIELGCADRENPCKLPNAMAGDPPLKQVVARTIEAGLRGQVGSLKWNAGVFRAHNHDDILFVADNQAGFGYFRNFGTVRRQGIEAGLSGRAGTLTFGANYTYLDATYRSTEVLNGSSNSSNDGPAPGFEGNITVHPGDRLPLAPRNIAKLFAELAIGPRLTLSADLQAASRSESRGNENGRHQPDGVYYLGRGASPGYAVVNMGAAYRPTPRLRLFVQVDNVFDTRYFTGAQLAATGFDARGRFVSRPFAGPVIDGERPLLSSTFLAPGAERTIRAGVRYTFR
jgi:outer membrane receptor protein involved in Fe transport